jgi:hypothetical protein
MKLCGGLVGSVPGRMFVYPGDIGVALDTHVTLRWRFSLEPSFCYRIF